MILFMLMRWNKPLDQYIVDPRTVETKVVGSQEDLKPATMTHVLEFKEDLSEN